jgi:acyl-CoA synthetase (AMP-forming)/AMP-acid ligase II
VFNNFSATTTTRKTWEERLRDAHVRMGGLAADTLELRLALVVEGPVEALEALTVAVTRDLDFAVVEVSRLTPDLVQRLDSLGFARVFWRSGLVEGGKAAAPAKPGRVSVFSSGTTGLPKAIEHNWQTLNTLVRVKDLHPRSWFVPYQPGSYAWYQMMCLGLFSPGQDVYCASPAEPLESFVEALEAGVTAVSSTPTFWRYVFLHVDERTLRSCRLETISLGGEIVDQAILDRLATTFPNSRIRHIYASSEAGAAIVTSDGKTGFPADRLGSRDSDGVGLRVEGGRLMVRSDHTAAAAAGNRGRWVDTGDLVEVRGDRVFFLGRAGSTTINVGGNKAYPAEIEAVLMRHPNVLWAEVFGRRSPLVGAIPAARVVLNDQSAGRTTEELELSRFARRNLPEHAVPRSWEFCAEIPLQPSLKS